MCLRVSAPGLDPALADVGFGECFDTPVPLIVGVEHHDTNGVFRLERIDDESIDLFNALARSTASACTTRPIEDFAAGSAFHQSPDSHFKKNTICSVRTDTGRITLRGLTLVRTVDGERRQESIDPSDLAAVLATEFEVHLSNNYTTDSELRAAAEVPEQPDQKHLCEWLAELRSRRRPDRRLANPSSVDLLRIRQISGAR